MKNRLLLLFSLVSYVFSASASDEKKSFGIIPAPAKMDVYSGVYKVPDHIAVKLVGFDVNTANLQSFAKKIFASNGSLVNAPGLKIYLDKSSKIHSEGYELSIDKAGISINSSTEKGAFYGLQTLAQLWFFKGKTDNTLPFLKIEDYPRYQYRGLHLDVSRHLFPVSFIKEYIDMMSYYKLNTFHWHLTEDQGWRIEIKKYPKLTEVGGYRERTLIGYLKDYPQQYDSVKYGGFYTQKEIKEVVAYATSRYIDVIPEIEMPGHSMAALSAYPELACGDSPGPFKAAEKWGVFEDVYCAGKNNTFDFLEDVLDEVIELFPSKYIHIGGDESPKSKWESCKHCQSRMKKENLKDEHELQSYFIQRIEKYVNKKGKRIVGWDEILEGGLAPNATVMSWRGIKGGIAAAKQHHEVIMTPAPYLYFDKRESKSPEEPLTIGGYLPLSTVYSYDPTPNELNEEEKKYVIGVQANLWSEYIRTPSKAWYMLFPRLFALSEISWTPLQNKSWEDFSENRVPLHLRKLDDNSKQYRVPEPIGAKDTTIIAAVYTLDYKLPVAGAKIYYTINGKTPYDMDINYVKPINISIPKGEERVLKSVVISPSGRRSVVVTTLLKNTVVPQS